MKKNLIVSGLAALGSLLSLGTASAQSWIDPNNEYIINPNLPMYKQYEWATWKDSAGGRLSRDPKWFILPADHYIPKEVPFDWDKVKNLSALEKRNAYFNHLCKTESVGYRIHDYPYDIIRHPSTSLSTWLYLRSDDHPVKNLQNIINNNPSAAKQIFKTAYQNPYIKPNFGYHNWNENMTLRFDLRIADDYYYSQNYGQPLADTFREYMLNDGSIWRIRFDIKTNKFLPLIKVDKSEAQYYVINREIERNEMKKLGIAGNEVISVDTKTGKLMEYSKFFQMPLYMDSLRASGNDVPIDWFRQSNCAVRKPQIVDNLSK